MKKIFKLEELDCAHCVAKMQASIAKIDGVKSVSINFLMQKMTLEADDASFDEIVKKAQKAIKKIEPDCKIVL